MEVDNEITLHNIADQLKHRLQGTFLWPLLVDLESKLSAANKNPKDIVNINKWFKEELERLVDSNDENVDSRYIMVAQSLLDLVDLKANFTSRTEEEIIIHTAQYINDGLFEIKKGSEVDNKDTFTLGGLTFENFPITLENITSSLPSDVIDNVPYYKCHNSTPTLVEEAINDKILRFSNLFKDFCLSKGLNFTIKPMRSSSDTDVTIYGRIGSEDESFIDELNVTLQGTTTHDFGMKVQIQNLQQVEELCVFPGQMVR